MLNTVKVPCDPAQVIVNHASFRVRLGGDAATRRAVDDTIPMPVIPTSVRSAAEARIPGRRRSAPVVWSGRTEPGDAAATPLLQAVRSAGGTQLLPRVDERLFTGGLDDVDDGLPPVRPVVVTPRAPLVTGPAPGEAPGRGRPAHGPLGGREPGAFPGQDTGDGPDTPFEAYPPFVPGEGRGGPRPYGSGPADETLYGAYADGSGATGDGGYDGYDGCDGYGDDEEELREAVLRRRAGEPIRHTWYPGRRMNLGVVLLPLRVFLGFISIYAGMGKLCDPGYFSGGHRGSMVHWLSALHPWPVAEPLRATALAHPVGAGLTVAFLQVVVGVLTICGLWQRVAAAFGAALSMALLLTVSWRTVPVYDAPHIIYLAAWSPLVIAGAPAYSVDARLAGEAWRRLGPRAPLWELRRFVLRRGVVLTTVVAGGSLIAGALFGSAARVSQSHPPAPVAPSSPLPTNDLPGSPLPEVPGTGGAIGPTTRPHPAHSGPSAAAPSPSDAEDTPSSPGTGATGTVGGAAGGTGGTGHHVPSQQQTVQAPPAAPPAPHTTAPANPSTPGGGSSGGSLGGLLGSKPATGWLLGMPGRHGSASDGVA